MFRTMMQTAAALLATATLLSASLAHAGPLTTTDKASFFYMGYQVQPTPAGYRVTGIGLDGPGAFGDGTTLDVGDVITQVGNKRAPFGGATLPNMVKQAYNQGAPFIIVRSASDNNFYNVPLP